MLSRQKEGPLSSLRAARAVILNRERLVEVASRFCECHVLAPRIVASVILTLEMFEERILNNESEFGCDSHI